MNSITLDDFIEQIDWESVILQLTTHTHYLIRNQIWFRGKNALPKGFEIDDFVFETIKKFLEAPDKFDPDRNDNLMSYLKYNILRRLVSNLSNSKDNSAYKDLTEEELINKLLFESEIETKIDIETISKEIEKLASEDDILEDIFYLLYYEGYKREAIYTELEISSKEYDNCIRRLRTITKNVMKKYSYARQ